MRRLGISRPRSQTAQTLIEPVRHDVESITVRLGSPGHSDEALLQC
jgi:hypothetical protein